MAMVQQMFAMFKQFQEMQQTLQTPPQRDRDAPYRDGAPFRGRAPYYPQGNGGGSYQGPSPQYSGGGYQGGAPGPRTAAEQFREAMGVFRTASDMVREIHSLVPEQASAIVADEEDDSPIRIIDTGPAKIVVNKEDGSLRKWETAWSNMGTVLKWVGEQREEIQKHAERRRQQPRRQLAPGYVEVHEGYEPPPGYVAVPVEQIPEQSLPPTPERVPPPIEDPPPKRTWAMPKMPDQEES